MNSTDTLNRWRSQRSAIAPAQAGDVPPRELEVRTVAKPRTPDGLAFVVAEELANLEADPHVSSALVVIAYPTKCRVVLADAEASFKLIKCIGRGRGEPVAYVMRMVGGAYRIRASHCLRDTSKLEQIKAALGDIVQAFDGRYVVLPPLNHAGAPEHS